MSEANSTPVGVWQWAHAQPDRRAVVEADGSVVTFGELAGGANQVLHGLRALGCQPAEDITVMLPNAREYLMVYLACIQGGFYFTPLNYHLTASEVSYVLSDAEAVVFIAHRRYGDVAQAAALDAGMKPERCFAVGGSIEGFESFADLVAPHPTTRPADTRAGDRMIYTSGTTGKPKGIRRPLSKAAVDDIVGTRGPTWEPYGLADPDGVHLVAGPLYHSAPSSVTAGALHSGNTAVLLDGWDATEALRLIERYRVTTSHMVPTMFHRLLQLPDDVRSRSDVSSLKTIVHGAAPISRHTKRRMIDWWGPIFFEYFGSTEVSSTGCTSTEWLERPGTVGRPLAGTEVRIVDAAGNDLPAGTAGRIFMRSRQPIFEYFKAPEKTAAGRFGEWITVGDIGYVDEEGYLFPVDRESNMIISGGVNIYPAETEAVFTEHDAVGDVAVFGVPNDEWGEEVRAVIELRAGVEASAALADELIEFCRSRLAHYKCPRSIEFRNDLPRADNGKLYKRLLRDEYWQGRDRAI